MRTINVLLIEDDEDQIFLTKKALSSDNFDLEVAMRGKAALKKILEKHFDMLLLDYKLPDITGIEILKDLRQRGIDIPTIMITGAGSEEVAVEAMKRGAVDYIVKSRNYHSYLPHYIVSNFEKCELEREIKETRELLENIVENSADIIISTDLDGKITSCNRIVEKISGWKKEEIIGKRIERFTLFETISKMNVIRDKVKLGGSAQNFEVQGCNKNKQELTFNVTVSPVKNADGIIVGASIIARDITEKVRMERRVKQAEKEVELYDRLLRHNVNNMNQIAIGYLSLLGDTEKLSEEQQKLVTRTAESIKSSTRLIDIIGKLQKSKKNFDDIYQEIAFDFSEISKGKG